MDQLPRSTRPTPRTQAALEAELRRHVRRELANRPEQPDGSISDEALGDLIASTVAQALFWHLDSPDHARGIDRSGARPWRPAPGPRGAPPRRPREWDAEAGAGPPPDTGRGGGGRRFPDQGPPRPSDRPAWGKPGFPPRGGGKPFGGGRRGPPGPGGGGFKRGRS